jgi:hypothetical protein
MKKKIINGIMMVALVAATSTSFVSCKDTNEDVRVEQAIEIAALQGRLTTLENQYGDLDGRVSAMKNRLDDVQALAEQNRDDIDVLQLNVDAIEEEISELEVWITETFAKLVTSVEISGTFNNMTGSINIPGFEPKMLIFNYGVASKDGIFPKTVEVDQPLEWFANEQIGAGEYNPGNAGFIYANVNRYLDDIPLLAKWQWEISESELKFPFFDFALVNTAGEEADGVLIGNVNADGTPTTDVLQWGWTRADNNIYKFGVAYGGEDAGNFTPAKIDLSILKNDLKAIWADRNRQTGTSKESLGQLLADLYYNVATKDTNMKKYALKISWADNTINMYENDDDSEDADYADIVPAGEDAEGVKHMVTSEAELVFAAIKPLGFTSGDALAEKVNSSVKGFNNLVERSERIQNKIYDKIKKSLPNFDPNQIQLIIEGGNLHNGDGVTAPTWWIETKAVPTGVYVAGVDVDLTGVIEPLNTNLENVQDMFAKAESMKQKLNASNVTNWVEKFTNKFNKLFANNADQMLQPVLLAVTENGTVNRVSGLKASPYVVAGEVTLKPTTYTAEIFAPAYAKYVGCEDIDAENFNQILFSGDQELKFTPEAGKLYEIVYEAVDYFGNTFEHTYYIQGK